MADQPVGQKITRGLLLPFLLAAGGCVGTFDGGAGSGDGTGGPAPGGSGNGAPGSGDGTGNGSGNAGAGNGSGNGGMSETGPRPMPSASGTFACDPKLKPATAPRLRRLTAAQWSNTVASFGLDPAAAGRVNPFDDGLASGRFSSDVTKVGMPVESLSLLLDAAESLATELTPKLKAQHACLGAAKPDKACLDGVLGPLATRAFRRPLPADELARYTNLVLAEQAAEGNDGALALAVGAIFGSPNFAFRFERGAGTKDAAGRVKLSSWEVASALAYTITDAPPDATLMAAAQANQLGTPAEIRAQVSRLLGPAGKSAAVARFLREYFRYPLGGGVFKDPKLFPHHQGPLLVEDTELFLEQSLGARKSFLETLFGSPGGVARAQTAGSYGLTPGSMGSSPAATAFPAGQRAGILTQPAFLVAFSTNDFNRPVQRGRFISENVLCRPVPDLPLTEVPPLPDLPNANQREKLAAHTAMPECAACHKLMDPFGLALEQYDHTGRYRTAGEGGKPIDASGTLSGAGDVDGPFSGPAELGQKLSRSGVVRQCFVLQAFRYWTGRDEVTSDGCALAAADEAFRTSNGDAVELFVSLLTSDAFLYRTAP